MVDKWSLGLATAPHPKGPWTKHAANPVLSGDKVCDEAREFDGICNGLYLGSAVYNKDDGIVKAAKNIPGLDVVNINSPNLLKLAPGGKLARTEDYKSLEDQVGEVIFLATGGK